MPDARRGLSLAQLARAYNTSRGTISRVLQQANGVGSKTCPHTPLQVVESTLLESAD
ncbi:MAG: hypothetical protein L0338_14675 [Acidobacteria bacterium]|nr:hypothetical protein [Acidobacteriota bacterium]